MVSIPHNAQTSSFEESDKLEATKERGGVASNGFTRQQYIINKNIIVYINS